MKSFMNFLIALILGIGITFISGLGNIASAKTAIVVYGGKSMSPAGDYSDYTFTGASLGAGVRFGMGHRFSFGLDYSNQKASKAGWEYGDISAWNGHSVIGFAKIFDKDISSFHIPDDVNYLLVYSKESKSTIFNMVTGNFYISLAPSHSVEPIVSFIAGFAVVSDQTDFVYHYDPVYSYIIANGNPLTKDMGGALYPNDPGNGHSRQTKIRSMAVGGVGFGLNIHLAKGFLISPEIRYLAGFGLNVRVATGWEF